MSLIHDFSHDSSTLLNAGFPQFLTELAFYHAREEHSSYLN